MSTSIFTFDHGQKKLHKAIGVNEQFLDDLASKLSEICKEVVDSSDEDDDASPSRVIQLVLEELSYSQLVIASGFYVLEKLKEIEHRLISDKFSAHAINIDDMPEELKNLLQHLKDKLKGEE